MEKVSSAPAAAAARSETQFVVGVGIVAVAEDNVVKFEENVVVVVKVVLVVVAVVIVVV